MFWSEIPKVNLKLIKVWIDKMVPFGLKELCLNARLRDNICLLSSSALLFRELLGT